MEEAVTIPVKLIPVVIDGGTLMTHLPTSPSSELPARPGLAARSHLVVRSRLLVRIFPLLFNTKPRVLHPYLRNTRWCSWEATVISPKTISIASVLLLTMLMIASVGGEEPERLSFPWWSAKSAVFALPNSPLGNEVLMYRRAQESTLTFIHGFSPSGISIT